MKYITTSLLEKYNTPETVVVVASYPGRKNRTIADIDAVASYTDHFSRAFQKELAKHGQKLVILAQKKDKDECYEENGMLICRVWDKGSPKAYAQILHAVLKLTCVRDYLVQFEFHQFGGNSTTATFPLFLAGLKLLGKSVTLVMHQVVDDIATLSGHVNIASGTLRAALFNTVLRTFYHAAMALADTVVVHNQILADRLTSMTGRKNIVVIPHGLGAIKGNHSSTKARKALGYTKKDFVVMSFGFLTWYKGTDWLVRQFIPEKRNVKLLVAGGESPNLKGKPHYQTYVKRIYNTAAKSKNIRITGFVEDKDIAKYFAATDLVVLPYRTLMSSSGPLAMTIAFKKPFLLSSALFGYTRDPDFSQALERAGLTQKDITFALSRRAFWRTIGNARNNKQLAQVSQSLSASRNWQTVAGRFAREGKSAIMQGRPSLAYATN